MRVIKNNDIYFVVACLILFAPFFFYDPLLESYKTINQHYSMIMSFVKFAILATLGEVLGLRIKTGNYIRKGFGIIPRALVWGFIGLTIQMAFVIFSIGAPGFLAFLGMDYAPTALSSPDLSIHKVFVALVVSKTMNIIYAPVMMTFHKITDTHIENTGGKITSFFKPMDVGQIISEINWKVKWNFVFKKTIPLFWIPAHTITFLLPSEYRVLFAALLGIMLGVFLAIAAVAGKK